MKILTRSHAEWSATLNVVPATAGGYAWEMEVHDPHARPVDHIVVSPVNFESSIVAAVDGLRAMSDAPAYSLSSAPDSDSASD